VLLGWPWWLWGLGLVAGLLFSGDGAGGPSPAPISPTMGNVPNLSDAFWQRLWAVAQTLGTTPDVLGLLLYEESGILPTAHNSFGCVGINQFCPGTFEHVVTDKSAAEYLALAAEDQLDPYVLAYWKSKPAGAFDSTRDLFWLSLTPVSWVRNADATTVVNDAAVYARTVFGGNLARGQAYAATVAKDNPAIADASGVITAGYIDAYLARVASSAGWQLALQKIAQFDPSQEGNA